MHLTSVEVWLFLFVLAISAPFVQALTAQPAARYALSAVIWDRHSVDIDNYPIGVDRATLDNGQVRSDKAPGQPLLAVPVYATARLFGAEPAVHRRHDGNLGLWWVTLWSVVVPLGILAILMRRVAVSLAAPAPTVAVLAIIFGSTIAAFTTVLFGHVLAATLAFAAWFVLRGATRDRRAPWIIAGFLVASDIVTEYTMLLLALVFAGYVLWRARERLGWFLLGGVPPALVAAAYQTVAFGAPWKVGYGTKNASGFFGIGILGPRVLARIFFDPKGLVMLTPIVLYAVWLAWDQARRTGPARVDAVIALACFGALLWLQASWGNPWGGEYPGPRYMVPALPILAIPLAVGWSRAPVIARTLALWSVGVMSLSYITEGLVAKDGPALSVWVRRVQDHVFTPTVWSMAFGTAGVIVQLLAIIGAGYGLARALRRSKDHAPQPAAVVATV
jgi:hypothetical protein